MKKDGIAKMKTKDEKSDKFIQHLENISKRAESWSSWEKSIFGVSKFKSSKSVKPRSKYP